MQDGLQPSLECFQGLSSTKKKVFTVYLVICPYLHYYYAEINERHHIRC
jgi:hypothetical protein